MFVADRDSAGSCCRAHGLRRRLAAMLHLLVPLAVLLAGSTSNLLAAPASLRVAVISDLNSSYGTVGHENYVHDAIRRIIEIQPDLVISTGDMIAGQLRSAAKKKNLDAMWQAFHESVSQPLAKAGIPLAVTPGNHDASAYSAYADERARYAREWRARESGLDFVAGQGYPFSYSFSLQDVLFVSLDVTMTGALPDKELAWLEAMLTEHRSAYREIVIFSHLPVWPVAEGRESEFSGDARLHELLGLSHVALYLSGHHHAFYPGVMDGVTYVSQACLGSGPRRLLGSDTGKAPRAFTLLEIEGDRIQVGSLSAPDFRDVQDWDELPREIVTPGARLRRADLADVAVTPLVPDRLTTER